MAIAHIHSFLVHPGRGEEDQPQISGTAINLDSEMAVMLGGVWDKAQAECEIEIAFKPSPEGEQENEARDLLLAYAASPRLNTGRAVASRLQSITTKRSGLGLLFLMVGRESRQERLLVSRFPADQGVLAQENNGRLAVEFVEQVFMKSATSYKSALYAGPTFHGGFWDGRAVDRQINGPLEVSNYWIADFLLSDLKTTEKAGSRRLADAVHNAMRAATLPEKEELIAFTRLATNQGGQAVTIDALLDRFGLSPNARARVVAEIRHPEMLSESFRLDADEFGGRLSVRSVELDNGAILTATNARFDQVFSRENASGRDGQVRFSTTGRVVEQDLRKAR